MEDFNKKQIVDENAQVGQENCQADQEKMTTEQFHGLLEENIQAQNNERELHQAKLIRIMNEYQEALDDITEDEQAALDDYRAAREEWEDAQDRYRSSQRSNKKKRNLTEQVTNIAKVDETARHALANGRLQSERHNIFKRWEKCGGELFEDAQELLHPDWKRANKEGGLDDGE